MCTFCSMHGVNPPLPQRANLVSTSMVEQTRLLLSLLLCVRTCACVCVCVCVCVTIN